MRKILYLIVAISVLISFHASAQSQLWSMTSQGGMNNMGAIFKMNLDGSGYTLMHSFDGTTGNNPQGSLLKSSTGKLYGMTSEGGMHSSGVLFSFNPNTNAYSVLYNFDTTLTEGLPYGSLIQDNGKLYGMTSAGGLNYAGTIFSFDTTTLVVTDLHDFDDPFGSFPYGDLKLATNGKMYGMTYYGGANGAGVLFSFDPTTNAYLVLHDFDDATGDYPYGSLMQAAAPNGKLYGMTSYGGANLAGVLFSFNPTGNVYSDFFDFNSGNSPWGNLIQATTGKLYAMTYYGGSNDDGLVFSVNPTTNAYDSLNQFNGTNGFAPTGSLFQASNGKLYGMTQFGGPDYLGNIFSIDSTTTNGNPITNLRNLDSALHDGTVPIFSNFIEVATPSNSITTGTISLTLCAGNSLTVPYIAGGVFNNGNVFTAQLSDAAGNFASPVIIGTLTSTTSGNIGATIPSNTPTGTGYRIRVVSDNPSITGSNNGTNTTIHPHPTPVITPSGATTLCQGGSVNLDAGSYFSYVWSNASTIEIITVTTSNTYHVTVSDNIGCTGTALQIVTVYPTYSQPIAASICQGDIYTFPDNTTSTIATIHTSHLNSIHTCDSAIVTTLSINPIYSIIDTFNICNGVTFTFPDGSTTTTATVHTSHLNSSANCDSSITTTVVLITVDTSVSIVGNTLIAHASAINYQWIDCSTMTPIPNATNQSFTPTVNGHYAVIISDSCTDTSACYTIFSVGLIENTIALSINNSPNPSNGNFLLNFHLTDNSPMKIKLTNVIGELIHEENVTTTKGIFTKEINISQEPAGIYFLSITIGETTVNRKIIVTR